MWKVGPIGLKASASDVSSCMLHTCLWEVWMCSIQVGTDGGHLGDSFNSSLKVQSAHSAIDLSLPSSTNLVLSVPPVPGHQLTDQVGCPLWGSAPMNPAHPSAPSHFLHLAGAPGPCTEMTGMVVECLRTELSCSAVSQEKLGTPHSCRES